MQRIYVLKAMEFTTCLILVSRNSMNSDCRIRILPDHQAVIGPKIVAIKAVVNVKLDIIYFRSERNGTDGPSSLA